MFSSSFGSYKSLMITDTFLPVIGSRTGNSKYFFKNQACGISTCKVPLQPNILTYVVPPVKPLTKSSQVDVAPIMNDYFKLANKDIDQTLSCPLSWGNWY